MDEAQEDPASVKKMKKLKKLQVSTNREYLDMDTDEEEFGRQETPEPEEELELEPEKPVFTAEELDTLVHCIKDLTTLASLTDDDWSQEVIELVEEYFRNPANIVLTIFWEARTLKALLDFPANISRGLTYFLRAPWQVYTPNNFMSTIIFGSIDGDVDNSTLKFMENIYAPIAFHSDEWPTVVRNELFSNLHEFLLCLTDATYSPMGLTIFYVPREGFKDNSNHLGINDESESLEIIEKGISEPLDEDEESLLERLERVARNWIRQIREALRGTSSCITSSTSWKTIIDEIHYWHYRYENLSCVYQQLTNKSILAIIEKLESARSASVKQYNPLVLEVYGMLDEATSNIKYLNLLDEFSKGFDIPNGIEEYATRILLMIKFIGTESSYYNTRKKIEILCRAFCVQAVKHCRDFIDLDVVLDGDADAGRLMLVKCIESCKKLSSIYDRLVDMDKISDSPTIALADKSKVFNHVDTLVHRCNDLIGITDARIAFEKSDEPITIFGPKEMELGIRYRNIEEHFNVSLNEIKNSRDIVLDIISAEWLDRVVAFKQGLKDIENMVNNWIDDIFEDVFNVEEGIEALHGIARFSRRPYLQESLNKKWIQIWKIYEDELESCSAITNRDAIFHHPSLPPFSGQANILRSNKIYLTKQHKMLIDASDWFGDCDAQTAVTRKYKRVLEAISEKEYQLFSKWQEDIAEKKINLTVISNQPIIKYHNNKKAGTIAVNLPIFYLDSISRESQEWTLLNYDMKSIFFKDCPKWQTLQSRYNQVEYLCKKYNSIVATAANQERFLYSPLFDNLEETLSSGFKKITWSSDSFERFFTDTMEMIIKIQDSFEVYENINWKVDDLIERIATTRLVNIDDDLLENLKSCETHLEQQKCQGGTTIEKYCKIILRLLLKLKSTIHTDEGQIANYWTEFVNKIYRRLKISFTNCTRLFLLSILQSLYADDLIKIDVSPLKVKQVKEAIDGITATALREESIKDFAELFNTIDDDAITKFLSSIDQDPQIIDLKKEINDLLNV